MYIRSIYLENYRCYKKQNIEFFPSGSKGILSIVEGSDGTGKTTIFNAIGWCLFGEETSVILEEPPQDLGIPSVSTIKESENGTSKVEVVICAEGEKDIDEMRAIRTGSFKGKEYYNTSLEIQIRYTGFSNLQTTYLDGAEAQKFIESIVSKDLLEFYMFNGEYLKRAKSFKGKNIESAIKGQFKFDALSTMERRLNDIMADYDHKRSNSTNEKALQAEIDNKAEDIKKLQGDLATHKAEKERYENLMGDAKNIILSNQSQRDELVGKKKILEEIEKGRKKLAENTKKYHDSMWVFGKSLIENAYVPIAMDKISKAHGLIKDQIGNSKLPPNIKDEFLKGILEMHKCICGTTFKEGSEQEENLKQLLTESELSSHKVILTEISPVLNSFIKNNLHKKLIDSNFHITGEEYNNIKTLDDEVKRIEESKTQLSEDENELIKRYDNAKDDYSKFEGYAENEQIQIDRISTGISSLNDRIDQLNNKIIKAAEKNAETREYARYGNITKNINYVVSGFKDKIIGRFVDMLEGKINSILSSINGLSSLSVSMGQENGALRLEFYDSTVPWGASYISEGQNQIISIILIAAFSQVLQEISDGDSSIPFIVMDHPFSDLGQPRKEALLKEFGYLFQGTRVIMMIPPGDFNKDFVSGIVSSTYSVGICQETKVCEAKVAQ